MDGLLKALEELLLDGSLKPLVPDEYIGIFFSDLMRLQDGVENLDEGPASSRLAASSRLTMDRPVSSISPASNCSSVTTQALM